MKHMLALSCSFLCSSRFPKEKHLYTLLCYISIVEQQGHGAGPGGRQKVEVIQRYSTYLEIRVKTPEDAVRIVKILRDELGEDILINHTSPYYITLRPLTVENTIIHNDIEEIAYSPQMIQLLDRAYPDEIPESFTIFGFLKGRFYILEYGEDNDPRVIVVSSPSLVEEIKKLNEEGDELMQALEEEFENMEIVKISLRAKEMIEKRAELQLKELEKKLKLLMEKLKDLAEIPRARPHIFFAPSS